MNLQQLHYFRTVAELEHYTKAAERLAVSPSSLSHSISDLEEELGVALFEPQGRNIRLTKQGKIYLSYVTKSLDMLEQGNAHMKSIVDPEACTVSIAYISSLQEFLSHLISAFLAETGNTKIKFQFYTGSPKLIENGLENGTYDIAFSSRPGPEKFSAHSLGRHELVAVVSSSHPLADRSSISVSDLAGEKLITYVKDVGNTRTQIDNLFQNAGIEPEIVLESTLDTYIISGVAANLGVALIPRPLSAPPYPIKVLSLTDKMPERYNWVLHRKVRFMPPAEKEFLDFIINNDQLLQDLLNNQRYPNKKTI